MNTTIVTHVYYPQLKIKLSRNVKVPVINLHFIHFSSHLIDNTSTILTPYMHIFDSICYNCRPIPL
jgi:hypothetical protein